MTGIEVRPLETSEWPLWRDLRLRALADAPDSFAVTLSESADGPDDHWAETLARSAASPRADTLVALVDGSPVGVGYVGVDDDAVGHVFAMWVDPGYRRRGVGSALIDRMRSRAAHAGARLLQLWVTVGNEAAETLYRRAGFEATGEVQPLRPGSAVMVAAMRCEL